MGLRPVRPNTRARREGGFAIVLVALLLVVMLVFAAFVVDLGAVFNARRNDQNAADVGALGGAALLINGATDAGVIEEVRTRVHNTLGETFTAAEWNSCTAAGLSFPAGYTVMTHDVDGAQDCIRKDGAANRVYVRVPEQSLDTAFGNVVGIDSLDHTAFAIAGMERVGFGSVLPFGFIAGSSYGCLKDSASGLSIPPCDGSDAGNFSYLDFTHYGDATIGTTEQCVGQEPERLRNNIAVGIDHDLSKFVSGGEEIIESEECGGAEGDSNMMKTDTGNRASAFGAGIYSGSDFSDGDDARLQRSLDGLFAGAGVTEVVGGHELDDNPLWEFLPETLDGTEDDVPDSCHRSVFEQVLDDDYSSLPSGATGDPDVRGFIMSQAADPDNPTDAEKATQMRWLLIRCFEHYEGQPFSADGAIEPLAEDSSCPSGCTDPVFTLKSDVDGEAYDIQLTPRFGYVPELVEEFFPPGASTNVHISTFRAVFLQRLLGECTGNSCEIDFEPMGTDFEPAANDPSARTANAITAFVFPPGMLPNGLSGEDAPFALGVNRFVRLLR